MSELGDVLGSDFESKYEEKTQQNREQRVSIEKEVVMAICDKAINGDGFDGENPRFRYKGGEFPHDVLLMETYDGDLGKFKNSFENGGMSFGMFHLDKLMSCAFNEEMLDVVDKIEPDSYYIVIGAYEEKKVQKDGEENTYYNVNPVRAVVPLHRAKKLAQEYKGTKDASSVEEQKEDQSGGNSSPDTDDLILKVLNVIGKKKEELISDTADGDEDALEKIVAIANNNLDEDVTQSEVVRVFESEIGEIDDGEDEEDDFDLGDDLDDDLDMGESDDSDDDVDVDDGGSESDDDDSTEDASDGEEDDDDESPDDWF